MIAGTKFKLTHDKCLFSDIPQFTYLYRRYFSRLKQKKETYMIISAIQAGYKCLKLDAEGQNLAGETCTKMSDKLKLTAIKISEKYL